MSRLTAIREALEQSPSNVALLQLLGHACLEDLMLDDAREAFELVLDEDPDHVEAQLGIARVLLLEGNHSAAAVRAERVLQDEPDQASAHLVLSRVLLAEGDRARALEHFEKAVRGDFAITDGALEQELGKAAADIRRTVGAALNLDGPALPEGNSSGEPNAEAGDDPFDEPFDDWRPDTFFAPGDPARSHVTFASVGGMEALKEEIRLKIVYPQQHPDLYKAYGRKAGGGLLIFGPPGCGKSLLLRAVAGEVGCNFFSIGLHEIFDPYFGSSEHNLHQAFETARSNAPCVLVFDEIDSLVPDRRHVRESQVRNLVNQFLSEMDRLRSEDARVLVLGATNSPWQLDAAVRRPGRFDQTIFVPPPDHAGRVEVLNLLAKDKPLSSFDPQALAKATEGFTGADLKWVFDRAAELSLSEAVSTNQPVPISQELLIKLASEHQPTASEWFEGVKPHVQPGAHRDALYNEVRSFLAATGR